MLDKFKVRPMLDQCSLSIPLENIKNQSFFDVFRGYRKSIGLKWVNQVTKIISSQLLFQHY